MALPFSTRDFDPLGNNFLPNIRPTGNAARLLRDAPDDYDDMLNAVIDIIEEEADKNSVRCFQHNLYTDHDCQNQDFIRLIDLAAAMINHAFDNNVNDSIADIVDDAIYIDVMNILVDFPELEDEMEDEIYNALPDIEEFFLQVIDDLKGRGSRGRRSSRRGGGRGSAAASRAKGNRQAGGRRQSGGRRSRGSAIVQKGESGGVRQHVSRDGKMSNRRRAQHTTSNIAPSHDVRPARASQREERPVPVSDITPSTTIQFVHKHAPAVHQDEMLLKNNMQHYAVIKKEDASVDYSLHESNTQLLHRVTGERKQDEGVVIPVHEFAALIEPTEITESVMEELNCAPQAVILPKPVCGRGLEEGFVTAFESAKSMGLELDDDYIFEYDVDDVHRWNAGPEETSLINSALQHESMIGIVMEFKELESKINDRIWAQMANALTKYTNHFVRVCVPGNITVDDICEDCAELEAHITRTYGAQTSKRLFVHLAAIVRNRFKSVDGGMLERLSEARVIPELREDVHYHVSIEPRRVAAIPMNASELDIWLSDNVGTVERESYPELHDAMLALVNRCRGATRPFMLTRDGVWLEILGSALDTSKLLVTRVEPNFN